MTKASPTTHDRPEATTEIEEERRDEVLGDAADVRRDRLPRPTLDAGVDVEVLSSFSGRWVPGFAVAEGSNAGYRLQRVSDRTVLPTWFAPEEIRVVST